MNSPVQRLFVALPLREAVRAVLHAAAADADLPALRPTPPDNLHLTLKFLGDTPAAAIAELRRAMRESLHGARPLELQCTGRLLLLPAPRRPRVLAAEIEPTPTLLDLVGRVEAACRSLGFETEQRPCRPHVTVGRFKFKGRPPSGLDAGRVPALSSRVDRVQLLNSDLMPDGAVHTVIDTVFLGEPSRAHDVT